MKREPIHYAQAFGFAFCGLVLGAVAGFALVFGVAMVLPRGNFGEMQGVAALDVALLAGAPLGAILLGAFGAWKGARRSRRRATDNTLPPT